MRTHITGMVDQELLLRNEYLVGVPDPEALARAGRGWPRTRIGVKQLPRNQRVAVLDKRQGDIVGVTGNRSETANPGRILLLLTKAGPRYIVKSRISPFRPCRQLSEAERRRVLTPHPHSLDSSWQTA